MPSLFKPKVYRYVNAEGKRVPKGTPGAKRVKEKARKWYGKGIPGWPKNKSVPLASDKQVARNKLNELVERAERGAAGMADLTEQQKPLAQHLEDFKQSLESGHASAKQVRQKVSRIRRAIESCGFNVLADINAERVNRFLADIRKDGPADVFDPSKTSYTLSEAAAVLGVRPASVKSLVARHRLEATGNGKARRFPRATIEALVAKRNRGTGVQTANYYLREMKSFCRWLVDADRLIKSPLTRLKAGNAQLDQRHARRSLDPSELTRFLDTVRTSAVAFRGLNGFDRWVLYATACGTGFRKGELAELTPELFRLNADPPTVTLPARVDKRKKSATQPLSAEIAGVLRDYLKGKPKGQPVWPGTWSERGVTMLRADLEAAGIPYAVEGPDGSLYCDFHSLRHTYITLLERSGVSLKQAQVLARHSDPKLTIGRYTHATLAELGQAVQGLSITGVKAAANETDPKELIEGLAAGLLFWREVAAVLLGCTPVAPGSRESGENRVGDVSGEAGLVAPRVAPNLATAGDFCDTSRDEHGDCWKKREDVNS